MKEKSKETIEMEEFLSSQGYVRKISDLRKRKNNILEIKLLIALEIVPEVAQRLGKDPQKIKNLVNSILT